MNLSYDISTQSVRTGKPNTALAASIIMRLGECDLTKTFTVDYLVKESSQLYQHTEMDPIKIVKPLKTFCLGLLDYGLGFRRSHVVFLKAVIQARAYTEALEVLSWPFVQVDHLRSGDILEYLFYAGIIRTVMEDYTEAIKAFELILRLETGESNIKDDAAKKCTLIKMLMGQSNLSAIQNYPVYSEIINKLVSQVALSPHEQSVIKTDGNTRLVNKLRETLLLKELVEMASIYNRIPLKTLNNPRYAQADTISRLNKLEQRYRYDPRSECIVFEGRSEDLEKQISKTVSAYFTIISQEKHLRERQSQGGLLLN